MKDWGIGQELRFGYQKYACISFNFNLIRLSIKMTSSYFLDDLFPWAYVNGRSRSSIIRIISILPFFLDCNAARTREYKGVCAIISTSQSISCFWTGFLETGSWKQMFFTSIFIMAWYSAFWVILLASRVSWDVRIYESTLHRHEHKLICARNTSTQVHKVLGC